MFLINDGAPSWEVLRQQSGLNEDDQAACQDFQTWGARWGKTRSGIFEISLNLFKSMIFPFLP
jgi:hypothetical protein